MHFSNNSMSSMQSKNSRPIETKYTHQKTGLWAIYQLSKLRLQPSSQNWWYWQASQPMPLHSSTMSKQSGMREDDSKAFEKAYNWWMPSQNSELSPWVWVNASPELNGWPYSKCLQEVWDLMPEQLWSKYS